MKMKSIKTTEKALLRFEISDLSGVFNNVKFKFWQRYVLLKIK